MHLIAFAYTCQVADLEALESNLEARASVAGIASAAVQQANEHERNQFRTQAAAQREQLSASIAWEFRKVCDRHNDIVVYIFNKRKFVILIHIVAPLQSTNSAIKRQATWF
jgi:Skp family chaperone for outer membrane proteins